MQSVNDFKVPTPSGDRPCLDVIKVADHLRKTANDPEMAEYFVRVEWLDSVPENEAFNEVGLFGSQNSVCQLLAPKWRHTVERLKTVFRNWDRH